MRAGCGCLRADLHTLLLGNSGNEQTMNAEEEPELPDYPKDPAFRAEFGPRGVMDCKASDRDDPTVDPRFGKVRKQVCKDTGPLTKARIGCSVAEAARSAATARGQLG
jgi:hypothetical protein